MDAKVPTFRARRDACTPPGFRATAGLDLEPQGEPEHAAQFAHAAHADVRLRVPPCLPRAWPAALCRWRPTIFGSGDQPCTTDPAVPVLADHIGGGRTLGPGGEGGARARAAASERLGARWLRYRGFGGVPDGARGCRAAVRVVPWTYGTGQASIVPVPCTYGVGLGALAVSRNVIVTSAFDICRVGDAVVSGRRKTGRERLRRGALRALGRYHSGHR